MNTASRADTGIQPAMTECARRTAMIPAAEASTKTARRHGGETVGVSTFELRAGMISDFWFLVSRF